MPAPLADIVSALSAEVTCAVCSESYAAVDQNACATCGTALCPDCARLRPDAQWTCPSCERRTPTRVFSLLSRAGSKREQSGSHTLNMVPVRAEAGAPSLQAGAVRSLAVAAILLAPLALLFQALRELAERAWPRLEAHFRRVQSSFRHDLVRFSELMDEVFGSALAQARVGLAQRVLAIRNISLREQLTALLLCAALLVAVARAPRHNSR